MYAIKDLVSWSFILEARVEREDPYKAAECYELRTSMLLNGVFQWQVVTADWVYLRFHGRNYQERYTLEKLQKHASWIRGQLQEGRDVFAYFNNDMGGHAAFNALELRGFVLGHEDKFSM